MTGKYIIFENAFNGLYFPVLFPDSFVEHSAIQADCNKPISAGFFSLSINMRDNGESKINVWGTSVSLKLKSRPEDEKIIEKAFGINN